MRKKSLISIRDLDKRDIENYLKLAERYENHFTKEKIGKVLATLFFEPSTRTNLSFQTSAKRLGIDTLNWNVQFSSTQKGESFEDTVKIVSGYADILVIRHPLEGAARFASEVQDKPVINAGDGANQHPTQTLLDLYTIKKYKQKIENVNITLLGDLKYARAMKSLIYGLAMFGANITLVSPKGLEMDSYVIREVKEKFSANIIEQNVIDLSGTDVLYLCRIQKERFSDPYEAEKIQKEFRVNMDYLKKAKDDLIIMHPLPKVDEVPKEVDKLKNAIYFSQAKNGVPVRMAVISDLLGLGD
ncbi:MAG: aspartate carbamoyltransferase [Candidatus Micrarchaeota archaeon]|nr:aspartate carbamoyltransferase [Candidatus Micrarchaeota archaeon]